MLSWASCQGLSAAGCQGRAWKPAQSFTVLAGKRGNKKIFDIDVPEVDVDIRKPNGYLVDESKEETDGGYVAVGGDLKAIYIRKVEPSRRFPNAWVKILYGGNITIWNDMSKTTKINSCNIIHNLPATVYVEGISPGTTYIRAQYTPPGGNGTAEDKVKITVIKVDLEMDIDDDGDVDSDDESLEDTTGAIVFENWDNDDADTLFTPDNTENTVVGENDLVRIGLNIKPTTLNAGIVKLTSNSSKIKVWKSATKNNQQLSLPASFNLETTSVTMPLYIEGFDESTTKNDITLTLTYIPPDLNTTLCADKVKLTIVRQNLGVACYRQLDSNIFPDYNHAGFIAEYTGKRTKADMDNDAKWNVIQMPGISSGPNKITLAAYKGTGLAFYGFYSVNSLADVFRNKIIKTSQDILANNTISYTWTDAISWNGLSWDGTIGDIRQLRCDGLVEVCYENAFLNVWGKNGTHYRIQYYPSEHNNLGKDQPQVELSPIVQRGGVSGSPTKFKSKYLYQPNL